MIGNKSMKSVSPFLAGIVRSSLYHDDHNYQDDPTKHDDHATHDYQDDHGDHYDDRRQKYEGVCPLFWLGSLSTLDKNLQLFEWQKTSQLHSIIYNDNDVYGHIMIMMAITNYDDDIYAFKKHRDLKSLEFWHGCRSILQRKNISKMVLSWWYVWP